MVASATSSAISSTGILFVGIFFAVGLGAEVFAAVGLMTGAFAAGGVTREGGFSAFRDIERLVLLGRVHGQHDAIRRDGVASQNAVGLGDEEFTPSCHGLEGVDCDLHGHVAPHSALIVSVIKTIR